MDPNDLDLDDKVIRNLQATADRSQSDTNGMLLLHFRLMLDELFDMNDERIKAESQL